MAVDKPQTSSIERKKGGWMTFPFIIGAKVAVGVAAYGLSSNLTVYLIQQFNVPSIDATQISNIVTGSSLLAPVVGAIVSDSGSGCFNVICGASVASFLGSLLFVLMSVVPSLRPASCLSEMCQAPASWQLVILYTAVALILAGLGGTRFVSATFGASQLDSSSEKATFFNWYVVFLYITALLGLTVVVYVQVNLGWTRGFTLSALLSVLGLLVLLLGTPYYRHPKPSNNSLLKMILSPVVRRKKVESFDTLRHYERLDGGSTHESQVQIACPGSDDLITAHAEGEEIAKDELSVVVRLIPLISTAILVNISTSMVTSFSILQALVMDRELGPSFTIPASSMPVFIVVTPILSVPFLEYVVFPIWQKLTHSQPTVLQRIGIGYFISILAPLTAAVIESRRLDTLLGSTKAMSVLWLLPSLVLAGLGEAFNFPGQMAFYYEELPASLSSSATGVISLVSAIGSYTTTAVIALIERITPWLQDDTNESRLDNVYWTLAVIATLNLGYFLICAKLYKRKGIDI